MGHNRRQSKSCETVEDTRQRLIAAGLLVFSQHNYEAATTRLIAEKAGVNLAAILYHFGGKEGLYQATILSILDRFKAQILPQMEILRQQLNKQPSHREASREEYIRHLCEFLSEFITRIISMNTPRSWLRLGFSEDNAPVRAFDLIYEGIICPLHELVGELVAKCLNLSPHASETILRTHAIMGQVIAFHLSREAVLRRLNQSDFSAGDIQWIQRIIADHVQAILNQPSRLQPSCMQGIQA